MICPSCATAADESPGGHDATVCRDHAIRPHGCPCGHRPSGVTEAGR